MKKLLIKSLLLTLSIGLSIFAFFNIINVNASSTTLSAGESISVSPLSGNLNNINIKIEFTTTINLDGDNNALLVALLSSDNTVLTDTRFIGQSTSSGLYDEDGVALMFENAPSSIGNKTQSGLNYTYTIETRDFTIKNGTKNIAKLVVVAQKGTKITSNISISEVKYSVKFGDHDATLFSYNALINTCPTGEYTFDIDGHSLLNIWTGNDSSVFVNGTTRATKNITYIGSSSAKVSHNWEHFNEVTASRGVNGTKAHDVCSVCGAIRLNSSLVESEDLVLVHSCSYDVSYDWSSATTPGSKPAVTYTCTDPNCAYSHTLSASEVSISEKGGSRVNPTCETTGEVTYIASATYEGHASNDEHTYTLAKTSHSMVSHSSVAATCTTTGSKPYYTCSICSKNFKNYAGTLPIDDLESYITIPALGHDLIETPGTPATCTDAGVTASHSCSRCDYTDGGEVIPALGHLEVIDAAKAATCTETGLTEGKHCSRCSAVLIAQNVVQALGHALVDDPYVAPTCTEAGREAGHHCSRCDYTDGGDVIPALDHVWQWVIDKEATFTETGLKHEECTRCHITRSENTIIDIQTHTHVLVPTERVEPTCTSEGSNGYYTCSVCSKHFSDEAGQLEITNLEQYLPIPALGHAEVVDAAVQATCTTTGKTEGKHCSRCGEVLIAQDTTQALGHNLINDAQVEATCTTPGREAGHHCSRCDFTDGGDTIPALGHLEVIDAAKAATCTTTGLTEGKHCSRCNSVLVSQQVTQALGHDLINDAEIAPTCTEAGREAGHHCSRCDYTDGGDIIPATGHTIVFDQPVNPTCTESGLTGGSHCSLCGTIISAQEPIGAVGHDYRWIIDKEATYTETGLKHEQCSKCFDIRNKNTVIDVLPHNHELVLTQEVAATCTEAGRKAYYTCSICSKHFSDSLGQNEITNLDDYLPIPIKGHTFGELIREVSATCTETGIKAHKDCSVCSKHFDIEGNEITDLIIPMLSHSLTKVNKVDKTCTEDGHIEYYICSICSKKFSDAQGTNEVSDIIIPKGHKLVKNDAVEATCTSIGNIEYYHCSLCDKDFDVDGNEVDNPFIPYKHSLILYNAKDATCTADGNIKYYHCTICNKNFSDEACTNEVNDITVKSEGHQYVDGRCSVCGKTDPNYVEPRGGCKSSISSYCVVGILFVTALVIRKKKKYIE